MKCFLIGFTFFCFLHFHLSAQQEILINSLSPNDTSIFTAREPFVLKKSPHVKTIFYEFNKQNIKCLLKSIRNNPQLKTVNLINPSGQLIQRFMKSKVTNRIESLSIFEFQESELVIEINQPLERFEIFSDYLESISLNGKQAKSLKNLSISCPKLIKFQTVTSFYSLQNLYLNAVKLNTFPSLDSPNITSMVLFGSFDNLPQFWCDYRMLKLFELMNYRIVDIPLCLRNSELPELELTFKIYKSVLGPLHEWFQLPEDNTEQETILRMPKDEPSFAEVPNFTEVPPSFTGGKEALDQFIAVHLNYPASAVKEKIEGKVFVEFIIEIDGTLSYPRIVRGIHNDLDLEALRLVLRMPKWIPGKNAGKPVVVRYILPIEFKLK